MDFTAFETALRKHAEIILKRAEHCSTEEATKTSMILPFFQNVLGYDISDPTILIPEYDIQVEPGKHERADYALKFGGNLEVIIEAKWNKLALDGFKDQLARYVNTTPARIGILTNGVHYLFFSDLDENSEMDQDSHFELDLNDISASDVKVLFQYHAENFNAKSIVNNAKKHQTYRSVKRLIYQQLSSPDKQFAKYVSDRLKMDTRTSCGISDMQELIHKAVVSYVESHTGVKPPPPHQPFSGYTESQLEAFHTICAILHNYVPRNRLVLRKKKVYISIHLDNKANRWICRFYQAKDSLWQIHFPTDDPHKPDIYNISTVDELFLYQSRLLQAIKKQDPTLTIDKN